MKNSLEYRATDNKTFIYLAVVHLGMYSGFSTEEIGTSTKKKSSKNCPMPSIENMEKV